MFQPAERRSTEADSAANRFWRTSTIRKIRVTTTATAPTISATTPIASQFIFQSPLANPAGSIAEDAIPANVRSWPRLCKNYFRFWKVERPRSKPIDYDRAIPKLCVWSETSGEKFRQAACYRSFYTASAVCVGSDRGAVRRYGEVKQTLMLRCNRREGAHFRLLEIANIGAVAKGKARSSVRPQRLMRRQGYRRVLRYDWRNFYPGKALPVGTSHEYLDRTRPDSRV